MSTATAPAPRVSRRAKIVAAVVVLLMVGGIAAWAAVQSRANLNGKIGRGQFILGYSGTAYTYSGDGTVIPGTGYNASKTAITLPQPLTVYNGEFITVEAPVSTLPGSGRTGYVSGLAVDGAMPAGWTVELVQGCGAAVSSAGTPVKVKIAPTSDSGPALDATALNLGIVATAIGQGQSVPTGVVCDPLGS